MAEKIDYEAEAERLIKKTLEMVRVGQKWVKYPELPVNHPNRQVMHIRAIIDEDQIVVRTWLRHKKYWYYSVEWAYGFGLYVEAGSLVKK